MATQQKTADFLTEQMSAAGTMRNRKMFGEYAIYCDEKVVAFVCDEQLFVKPTIAGKEYIGDITEAPPYPGAKMYYLISEDKWDDAAWLAELTRITADALPAPKPKKPKKRI